MRKPEDAVNAQSKSRADEQRIADRGSKAAILEAVDAKPRESRALR